MGVNNSFLRMTAAVALAAAGSTALAQSGPPAMTPPTAGAPAPAKLPAVEIEKLVAPIALYPDVLLAQMLPASTYPMDVVMAGRWLRSKPDMSKLLDQPWDPSVLSLCHYPDALYKLDADLEWTNALGATFLDQQADLMAAIQSLRAKAKAAGALQSSQQQTVVEEEGSVLIVPADPQVVYVPQYNSQVIYVEDDDSDNVVAATAVASAISFGAGLALGAWLDTDCDWHGGAVHYCQPGYWGGYGAIHGHAAVAWGNDWAAAVGPRRAAVAGPNGGGAYVGPRGAAVWGENGHGAAWSRGGAAARPYNSGRYSNYGGNVNRATQVNRGSNNQINVNQNNVNIDRGNNTNINNRGNNTNVSGNNNLNRGNTANARSTPYSSSHNASDTRNMSNRGEQSRAPYSGGASNASQQPRSTGAAQQPRSGGGSQGGYGGASQRSNAFSGSGGSARQTQQSSNRGSASRGASRGGGGGGGGGRGRR